MEQETTNEITENAAEKKTSGGLSALLGKLDTAGEASVKKIVFNLPFLAFLIVLAILHIANSHTAENYARTITKTEREVKQLRWQYMTTASSLMQKSKQSEVVKLVGTQGLKELRVPPYKIEETKN